MGGRLEGRLEPTIVAANASPDTSLKDNSRSEPWCSLWALFTVLGIIDPRRKPKKRSPDRIGCMGEVSGKSWGRCGLAGVN